jgi:hypothetical protein
MIAQLIANVSANKITWGVASLIVSMGSRFVMGDLTPKQQELFHNPVVKRVVIFCILYMPTRDILLAACLTVVACTLMEHVLNEESPYCALPDCFKKREESKTAKPISTTNSTLPIGLRVPLMGPSAYAAHMAHPTSHQKLNNNNDVDELLYGL